MSRLIITHTMSHVRLFFLVCIALPLGVLAQNVGIGTDVPAARLHVVGESSFAGPAQLTFTLGADIVDDPPSGFTQSRQSISVTSTAQLTSVTFYIRNVGTALSTTRIDVIAGDLPAGGAAIASSSTLNIPVSGTFAAYTFNFPPGTTISGGSSITFDPVTDQTILFRGSNPGPYPGGEGYFGGTSFPSPGLDFRFSTTFTEATAGVVATKDGRLGVGTTTPTIELDVDGSADVAGTMTAGTLSSPNTVDAPFALQDVQFVSSVTPNSGSAATFANVPNMIITLNLAQPSRLIVDAHISRAQHTTDGVNTEYRLMAGATEIARTNTGDHDGLGYATVHLSASGDVLAGITNVYVEYRTASGTEQWLNDADGSQFRSLRVQVLQAP